MARVILVTFLDRCNLPIGILLRYRGNRLHILFHNAEILIEHKDAFAKLLVGITIDGLRSNLENNLKNEVTLCELQVLGLLGGPFKCYVTLFFGKLDPHPPPRNANNIEHYTFVTLFPEKLPPRHPHRLYVTLEWPLGKHLTGPWKTKFYNEVTLCELQVLGVLGKHLTGPWKTKFYNEVTLCELQVLGVLGKHLTGSWKTKFYNEVTLCELQVLGLLGKHLTGPWKTKFYNEVTLCELQVLGLLGKQLTGPWKTKFYNEVTLCEL